MSTRASVAIVNKDGTVNSIYNHYDGYVDHLGKMLKNHYNTPEAVRALLAMGDASFIGEGLADSVFYHRDRKEPMYALRSFPSVAAWLLEDYREYMYLFLGGEWFVYTDQDRRQAL